MITVVLRAQISDIQRLKAALPAARDSMEYTDMLNRLAVLYQACQLDSCGVYAHQALDMATRLEYRQGRGAALRAMASYYAFKPNRYLSYLFYNDALTESRHAGDSASVALVLMNIGIYYNYERRKDLAWAYTDEALAISRQLQNDSLQALILANYYSVHADDTSTSLKAAAAEALSDAAAMAHRYHDHREELYIRLFQAHEQLKHGDNQGAVKAVQSVIDTASILGLRYLALYGCLQMAGYKTYLRQPDTIRYYRQGMQIAMDGGYTGLMLPTAVKLYEYSTNIHDYTKSQEYLNLMRHIMMQQEEDRKNGGISYLDYARQDRLLDSLQLQHLYQEKLLARKSTESLYWRYLLIFLTVLLLLIFSLLLHLFYANKASAANRRQLTYMQREINQRTAQLQVNDDFKNKLISLIAHDFRSPLNNIIGITSFVEQDALTVDDAASLIIRIESTATATLQVFEAILRWMRTQLSGFVYRPQCLSIKELVAEAEKTVAHILAEKSLRAVINIPDGMLVKADYEMLQFIHRNFLHNAAKFSPANGVITVSAIRIEEMITVSFTDEGTGMDAETLAGLFTCHQPGGKSRTGKGAGIALIICKDFTEKMNGKIWAENNPGKGATFYYSLPAGEEEDSV
ncbi:sensor histidine kinase [Chitinophaga vietnamensis]|uniref:sensor histidine kinase n=1 Tax=Chitinophaga vietnamensis TaxID=2593957 RepID=UPI0013760B45|nr:HAMP domain-containing sensor histidine kinase [Chitinophaga vietnamensis]